AGDSVIYRVDTGPQGNAACDWSYVRDLQFVRRLVAAPSTSTAAYPGVNLAPLTPDLRVVVADAKTSVFLHAPARITVAPQAGRYRISATYGLQSVAVKDPGCVRAGADGVGVSLVLHHGSRESTLWHVEVDPYHVAADRGARDMRVDAIEVGTG